MLNLLKVNPKAKNTTQISNRQIEYIVVHYTAGVASKPGCAVYVADYFNESGTEVSADFVVDDAMAVQYNPDLQNRYTWHCGRKKEDEKRNRTSSLCTNRNSIGIELCSSNLKQKITYPGDEAYYFTEAVLENSAILVGILMIMYDIDLSHVVRHYDVTGKECPGVPGWFGSDGGSPEWLKFKNRAAAERDQFIKADLQKRHDGTEVSDVIK